MRKWRPVLVALIISPIVAIISIMAAPFYAMCVIAGEKGTLNPMMDRVSNWLVLFCKGQKQ